MKSSYIAIDSNILINFVGFLGGGGVGGPKTKRLRYKTCLSK